MSRLSFGAVKPAEETAVAANVEQTRETKPREKKKRAKFDPKLVSAARELRDRWLEQVNAGRYLPGSTGKYDARRAIPAPPVETRDRAMNLLPAA
jgi:hypothetical protein